MGEVLRFGLLGLGLGALYALASQGLILIYRGSGVLNFAHGAIGMVAAYVCWDLQVRSGVPYGAAFAIGVASSAAIGALTHVVIMRRLRGASALARIVATLGVMILLQGLAILRYGSDVIVVQSTLPTKIVHVVGDVTITTDRLILVGISVVLSIVLWWVYRFTRFGMGTTAVAENERAAGALGWSPDAVAAANWALGSALAGVAAILIAPIVQLQAATMTTLVLAALAAALVANFRSFPIVVAAGIVIGIAQTEVTRFVTTPGLGESVPFAVIILVMIVRGQALPLRDFFLQRLPSVGSGRVRPWLVLAVTAVAVLVIAVVPGTWQASLTITFGMALVLLSIVVVTGYAGQISLAQYAVAGLGAWIAARLNATQDVPFVLAAVIGVIAAVPIGVLFALPAVRARGINLAVATFGLGTAIELLIFNSPSLSGGVNGTVVDAPSLFGLSLDPVRHPARYAYLSLGLFVLLALAVARVRRGRSGRRMLAVRTNERAAAALGISVAAVKAHAFGLSAAVASVGGIVIAFTSGSILFGEFTNFTSITAVAWSVIGGLGYVLGPVLGATFAPGALGTEIGNTLLSDFTRYIVPLSGLVLIAVLLQDEGGLVKQHLGQFQAVAARLRRRSQPATGSPSRAVQGPSSPGIERVRPRVLEASGISVRFGGVVAVDDLSLTVSPGRIVGLIGPNGAGKTTAIDAITGFVRPSGGSIKLDGNDITRMSAGRRARSGLSRSFQSLELFEDMTVFDNLRTAADVHVRTGVRVRDLVAATRQAPRVVHDVVREFGFAGELDQLACDLPFGRRRMLAIARAVCTRQSVLLLDEPAAGIGERGSAELASMVRSLADDWGMGVLLVEHDMTFVMRACDEIVVLDFGRTICVGTPDTVRNDPATIAAYLGEDDTDVAPVPRLPSTTSTRSR